MERRVSMPVTSIGQELQRTFQTKEAIKEALINKGIDVLETDPFSSYANKIANIVSPYVKTLSPTITILEEDIESSSVSFTITNNENDNVIVLYDIHNEIPKDYTTFLTPNQTSEKFTISNLNFFTNYSIKATALSFSKLVSEIVVYDFTTLPFEGMEATGGNIIYYEDTVEDKYYKIHAFLSNGSFEVTQSYNSPVELLIVGGGAGASTGGGGAGGVIYTTVLDVQSDTYSIIVGTGGAGISGGATPRPTTENPYSSAGGFGGDSSAFDLVAFGGGGGGGTDWAGVPGGSGGGSASSSKPANPSNGGASTQTEEYGYGNAGGAVLNFGPPYYAAGGGGAGSAGGAANSNSGTGGDAIYFGDKFSETYGVDGWFAGGGGGGSWQAGGVAGGAGAGSGVDSSNALPNTGSGGGGGRTSAAGGNGGSGIVMIRYEITESTYIEENV
jgi:hypothetical protein